MSYAIAQIESIFSDMRRLAPTLAMVRTDQLPAWGTFSERREVVFDKVPRRDTVGLTRNPDRRSGAISRLATFFGLTKEEAAELYGLAEQLHAINPVGSWCLAPAAIPHATRLGVSKGVHPLVGDVIADLRDALPAVCAIQVVSAVQNLPQGHVRRRVLVRFRAESRRELAALDTAHFSAHLSSLLLGTDEHAHRNIHRATVWASQLGIPLIDLPSVLHDLALISVSLPTTEIVLGPQSSQVASRAAQ